MLASHVSLPRLCRLFPLPFLGFLFGFQRQLCLPLLLRQLLLPNSLLQFFKTLLLQHRRFLLLPLLVFQSLLGFQLGQLRRSLGVLGLVNRRYALRLEGLQQHCLNLLLLLLALELHLLVHGLHHLGLLLLDRQAARRALRADGVLTALLARLRQLLVLVPDRPQALLARALVAFEPQLHYLLRLWLVAVLEGGFWAEDELLGQHALLAARQQRSRRGQQRRFRAILVKVVQADLDREPPGARRVGHLADAPLGALGRALGGLARHDAGRTTRGSVMPRVLEGRGPTHAKRRARRHTGIRPAVRPGAVAPRAPPACERGCSQRPKAVESKLNERLRH